MIFFVCDFKNDSFFIIQNTFLDADERESVTRNQKHVSLRSVLHSGQEEDEKRKRMKRGRRWKEEGDERMMKTKKKKYSVRKVSIENAWMDWKVGKKVMHHDWSSCRTKDGWMKRGRILWEEKDPFKEWLLLFFPKSLFPCRVRSCCFKLFFSHSSLSLSLFLSLSLSLSLFSTSPSWFCPSWLFNLCHNPVVTFWPLPNPPFVKIVSWISLPLKSSSKKFKSSWIGIFWFREKIRFEMDPKEVLKLKLDTMFKSMDKIDSHQFRELWNKYDDDGKFLLSSPSSSPCSLMEFSNFFFDFTIFSSAFLNSRTHIFCWHFLSRRNVSEMELVQLLKRNLHTVIIFITNLGLEIA